MDCKYESYLVYAIAYSSHGHNVNIKSENETRNKEKIETVEQKAESISNNRNHLLTYPAACGGLWKDGKQQQQKENYAKRKKQKQK